MYNKKLHYIVIFVTHIPITCVAIVTKSEKMPSQLRYFSLCCHGNQPKRDNCQLILLLVEIPFQKYMVCLCFGDICLLNLLFNIFLWQLLTEGAGALAHTAEPQEGDPDLCGKTDSLMVNIIYQRDT